MAGTDDPQDGPSSLPCLEKDVAGSGPQPGAGGLLGISVSALDDAASSQQSAGAAAAVGSTATAHAASFLKGTLLAQPPDTSSTPAGAPVQAPGVPASMTSTSSPPTGGSRKLGVHSPLLPQPPPKGLPGSPSGSKLREGARSRSSSHSGVPIPGFMGPSVTGVPGAGSGAGPLAGGTPPIVATGSAQLSESQQLLALKSCGGQRKLGLEDVANHIIATARELEAVTRARYVAALRASLARVPGAPPADVHLPGMAHDEPGSWPPAAGAYADGSSSPQLVRSPSVRVTHTFEISEGSATARVTDTEALRAAFLAHCNATTVRIDTMHLVADGPQMTAQQFSGLCRGLQMVEPEGPLSPILLGIIFCTHKSDDEIGLSYREWLDALVALALESCSNVAGLIEDQWRSDAREAVKLQRMASLYRRGTASSSGAADSSPGSPLTAGAMPRSQSLNYRASTGGINHMIGGGVHSQMGDAPGSPSSPHGGPRAHSRFRDEPSGFRRSATSLMGDTDDPVGLLLGPPDRPPRVSQAGNGTLLMRAPSFRAHRGYASECGAAPTASPPTSPGGLSSMANRGRGDASPVPVMRDRSSSMGRSAAMEAAAAAVAGATITAGSAAEGGSSDVRGATAVAASGAVGGKERAGAPSRFSRLQSNSSLRLNADKAVRVQEYLEWVEARRSESGSRRSSSEF